MKQTVINGILTEWDTKKEEANVKKHGVHFVDAVLVFSDENRIEIYDERHSVSEDRFIAIGLAHRLLVVVYTMRNDAVRIVSARIASKGERNLYYGNNQSYS